MNRTTNTHPMVFEAPGPGTWLLDAVHMPRPFSRFQAEIHPPNLAIGFRDSFRRYGVLLETLDYRMIGGFGYFAPQPAPAEDIPARFDAAAKAFEEKLWRADLASWDSETKPAAIRDHLVLQRIDPTKLPLSDLVAHVDRCREHLARMIRQHHLFNSAAIVPVGDFMAHVTEWTGLPLSGFLALLRGAAPESAGSFPELDHLAAAIRRNSAARTVVESGEQPRVILDRLLATPDDVGAAMGAYLDLVAYRLLDSLDTGEAYALEMPEVLVEGIRFAVEGSASAHTEVSAGQVDKVRSLVPSLHREDFDDLLVEARHMSRLRDERGNYSDVWAGGIMRRALLAAGSRLAADGRLHEAAHLVEGDYQEIKVLMSGAGGPTADDMADRADLRAAGRAGEVPPFLGPPPEPPPGLEGLPPAAARMMRAVGTAIDALFATSSAASDDKVVRGTGSSPGIYTGTARVVSGPAEFGRLRRGDVLVTASTTESFNLVLPLLGAIVTDSGGLLSHAAIVSREYGIPGVVGCRDATALLKDGMQVRVDGNLGEVRVVGP